MFYFSKDSEVLFTVHVCADNLLIVVALSLRSAGAILPLRRASLGGHEMLYVDILPSLRLTTEEGEFL